ncbi:hypothetical protein [Salibacterium sp. K-3]
MFEEIRTLIFCTALMMLYGAAVFTLFHWMDWKKVNYRGEPVALSAGVFLFLFVWMFVLYHQTMETLIVFLYTVSVWTAGWIDDSMGTAYPKGIRGHLRLLRTEQQLTTGVVKIAVIVSASAGAALFLEQEVIRRTAAFLLFLLSPHVCNLMDTRPLRVWKWSALHGLLILFYINENALLTAPAAAGVLAAGAGVWAVMEGMERSMLGDNGAALAGTALAWCGVIILPLSVQIFFIIIYILLTLSAEYVSFHRIIGQSPLLCAIDQFGRKK